MKRYLMIEVAGLIFFLALFFGCVTESRYLKNETVDTIVTRQPLPPPVPDAACYTLPRFRAVSLKQVQKASRKGLMKVEASDSINYLCGLKTVEGFFIDRKNNDLLIIGKVDDTMPPLQLDDFVVALRCAWKAYVVDNMFTPPGCSIDPTPEMLKRITEIEARIFEENSPSKWEKHRQAYESTCAMPQSVRVLGIPFNTHFASVMVNADFDMKRLVDGSDAIDIPGVVDLYALSSYDTRQAMLAGTDIEESNSSLSRFWFMPGQIKFVEQKNLMMLDACEIQLLTEEQQLTKTNKIIDSGRKDPYAQKVASNFTTYYSYIAQKRPIYRQLKELMRAYIVLEALYMKHGELRSVIDLNYFLSQYRVPEYAVSSTLPGRSRFAIENYERQTYRETEMASLILPLCGGVAFEVFLKDHNFERDSNPRLAEISGEIIKQRPHPFALFWDIVTRNGVL